MSASLSAFQVAVLCAYAAGMALGQLLFKLAAQRVPADGPLAERLLGLAGNAYFVAALAIYLGLSFLWVWLLRFTPLSRAYLFVALSFAIVPLLGAFVFAEPISTRLIIGVIVIVCGLVLVVA
jgi:undecaprenyl phosphate-alpha-L-ara4N flippase subunit ArnE